MITIYSCNITSPYLEQYGGFSDKLPLSNAKQWRYIKDVNKRNGAIATLPHQTSLLRRLFIDPNQSFYGNILPGEYVLQLNNFQIKYRIIIDHRHVFKS